MEVFVGEKQRDHSTVSIVEAERRKHMAIFGKSGVGKTTLIRNMVIADLAAGNGVTVVDPHGSLVEDLLGYIPRHRTNDVIYLNPADPSRVVAVNILEKVAVADDVSQNRFRRMHDGNNDEPTSRPSSSMH